MVKMPVNTVTLYVLGRYLTFIKYDGLLVVQRSQLEEVDRLGFHPVLQQVDTEYGQMFSKECKVCEQFTLDGVLKSGVYDESI